MHEEIIQQPKDEMSMTYEGSELELFSKARNWKKYWTSVISPYLKGRVIDVGSGIGGNAMYLIRSAASMRELYMLEPDRRLCDMIPVDQLLEYGIHVSKSSCTLLEAKNRASRSEYSDRSSLCDTILYIDVLEHIDDDVEELRIARSMVAKGGYIVVLTPAYNWLYSEFDKSIGHHRRYSKSMLLSIMPKDTRLEKVLYLDSMGLILSSANKFLLKQSMPSRSQVFFWDEFIVRLSRALDRFCGFRLGKTIVAIYAAE